MTNILGFVLQREVMDQIVVEKNVWMLWLIDLTVVNVVKSVDIQRCAAKDGVLIHISTRGTVESATIHARKEASVLMECAAMLN